jgi:hypothetical protein
VPRAERVVALTKIVRSEKAPRTGEYASNPERKNTPCISDLAGVKFLLKKERVFFFRGSALQVFGQCVGLQYGLGKTKIFFLGERIFRFASALVPPAGEVWGGGMRAEVALIFLCAYNLKRKNFMINYTYE